jgi:hypothetical protein
MELLKLIRSRWFWLRSVVDKTHWRSPQRSPLKRPALGCARVLW